VGGGYSGSGVPPLEGAVCQSRVDFAFGVENTQLPTLNSQHLTNPGSTLSRECLFLLILLLILFVPSTYGIMMKMKMMRKRERPATVPKANKAALH